MGHPKADAFLDVVDNRNWLHPFDEKESRQDHDFGSGLSGYTQPGGTPIH